jgi:hypothetical protein
MKRAALAALGLAALVAACAPSIAYRPEPSAVTPEDAQALESAQGQLASAARELEASRAAPAPDCARVCALAANVCALAERICAIAARYPPGDPVAARCADARPRCERARASVDRCACR